MREARCLSVFDGNGHVRSLREIERDVLIEALMQYKGSVVDIATATGISRSGLYRRFSEHGLILDEFRMPRARDRPQLLRQPPSA